MLAESLGDAPQRAFIGHHKRDHDGRRVAGGFGGRMGRLGNLRPMGEVAADDGVENLAGGGVGLSRRAFAFTVDALSTCCGRAWFLSRARHKFGL